MEFKGLGPDAWGKVAVTEIADDIGAILTIDKPDAASLTPNALDRPRERGAGGLSGDLDRYMLEIRFRSPALQARRLSSVKGSIGFLHYVAQKAAKIDNAILPEMIGAPDDVAYGNRDAKRFSHPAFEEGGIDLVLERMVRKDLLLAFVFSVKSEAAAVSQIQAFDSRGRPWKGVSRINDGFGDGRQLILVVQGFPPPPLSLAFLVRTKVQTTSVPFRLAGLPLMPSSHDTEEQPKTQKKEKAGKEDEIP